MIDKEVEIRRLAAVLHCSEGQLANLNALSGDSLLKLRIHFQDTLIDDFAPSLSKLAAASALTPTAMSEKICVRYLGPTLTSYLAYFTPSKTAAKLATRFDTEFMVELSKELVPERAKEMLSSLPEEPMRAVTRGLVKDCAWATMAGFVDYLPPARSLALMEEVPDPVACLWISSFAQNKQLIASMVSQFDTQTLRGLVGGSLTHVNLMREICVVAEFLPEASLEQINAVKSQLSEGDIKRLLHFAETHGFSALASQHA